MADGIDLTDFFARLGNSLLDLSRRLQCNVSEDTLHVVKFPFTANTAVLGAFWWRFGWSTAIYNRC